MWWPEELKEGRGGGDAWMDYAKTFFFHAKEKSSIKCKIKTEGGCPYKAEQPVVERAPGSRCQPPSEIMQTSDSEGWPEHSEGTKTGVL